MNDGRGIAGRLQVFVQPGGLAGAFRRTQFPRPIQLPEPLFQRFQPSQKRTQVSQIVAPVHIAVGKRQAMIQRFVTVAGAFAQHLVDGRNHGVLEVKGLDETRLDGIG